MADPTDQSAPIADEALLPVQNNVLLTIGIMTASLLQVLDTTIANVAIPRMESALSATPDQISWVLTSYIIAMAVAMPTTGWLADRIGSRNLFIISVAGFVATSMLCGMAQNLTQMVIFRALQGISAAFINPLSQAAMIDTNKPSRQSQMMALWGMGIMIGPIIGPILGGWLTENWNWRWVFYVNLPLGILSFVILMALLPSRPIKRRRFDLTGFALIAIALASVQLLLDRGNHVDWFDSGETWFYLASALGAGWMAVIHLTTASQPLFDRHMFANRSFVAAMLISLVVGVVMFATIALLPPMLQHLFGYSVIDTGIALMPRGVGVLVSMQLAGVLVRRGVDPRLLIGLGFTVAGISMWDMTQWSLSVDEQHIWASGLIQGIGLGLVFIPLNASAFSTLLPQHRTDGSSLLNLFRWMGSSIGISVVTTLLARNIQVSHQDLAGHVTASATAMIDFSAADRFQQLGSAALQMVDLEINRQAAMIAYINDFWLTMWCTFAAVPLVLLMKRANLKVVAAAPKDEAPH